MTYTKKSTFILLITKNLVTVTQKIQPYTHSCYN